MRLYVGNLSYETDEEALRRHFGQHGNVTDIAIPTDRDTGRSRGFGFVTMPDSTEAKVAMDSLSGAELAGRSLTISQAHPRKERPDQRRDDDWGKDDWR